MSPAAPQRRWLWLPRLLLFVLFVLTSPLCCLAGAVILQILPSAWVSGPLGLVTNPFKDETPVVNGAGETLYLTAFTTTYRDPRVIVQVSRLDQRDIPLEPGQTLVVTSDAADAPLAGLAVCRADGECRWLANYTSARQLQISAFEALPALKPAFLTVLRAYPRYSFQAVILLALGLIPAGLLAALFWLGRPRKTP